MSDDTHGHVPQGVPRRADLDYVTNKGLDFSLVKPKIVSKINTSSLECVVLYIVYASVHTSPLSSLSCLWSVCWL